MPGSELPPEEESNRRVWVSMKSIYLWARTESNGWACLGSNQGLPTYKVGTLTTELHALIFYQMRQLYQTGVI